MIGAAVARVSPGTASPAGFAVNAAGSFASMAAALLLRVRAEVVAGQ